MPVRVSEIFLSFEIMKSANTCLQLDLHPIYIYYRNEKGNNGKQSLVASIVRGHIYNR